MASAERVVDEGPAGRLEVAILGDPLGGTFNLDVAADNLLLDGLIAYAPVSADILPFSGKISGRMNAAVRDSDIAVFDLEAAATGGSLALPEPFRTIDYKTASMIATYHRDGGTLTVAQSEIVLNDGRVLSVQGNIAEIDSAVPVITGRIDGNDLSLDSFYADWPDTMAPQAKTMLQERFSGGQLSDLGIGIAAEFDRAARRLNILTLDLTTALSAVGVDIGAAQYERLQGTGDGTLSLRVGAGGVIQELSVAMGASNATLTLAGREAPLQVGRVQASGALQNNGLAIEEVSVNLANGGAISVSGLLGLGPSWTLAGGSLSLSANNMDARDFHDIWPNWAVSRTRNWVGRKIRSGRVEDVRLDLVSQRDENRLKVRQIDGSITVRDVEMALGGGVPVMTGHRRQDDNR
jgi:ribosomal protein S28E/S33